MELHKGDSIQLLDYCSLEYIGLGRDMTGDQFLIFYDRECAYEAIFIIKKDDFYAQDIYSTVKKYGPK